MKISKDTVHKTFLFTEKATVFIIGILMMLFMFFLTTVSLVHTTGMDTIPEPETVSYRNDWFIVNVIFLVMSFLICFRIMPLLKKIPLWAEVLFISLWTMALGIIWVCSSQVSPTADSLDVTNAALSFAKDDYSPLAEDNRYFRNYSYQLGYVLFNEIFIRIALIFGEVTDLIFLQILNVVLLALTNVGMLLINSEIFSDKRVSQVSFFLLLFSIQPILTCSFLYGLIPGITFAVWAVYTEILFLKKSKIFYAIISVVCIAMAIMIKSNNMIVLVAMMILAFTKLGSVRKVLFSLLYMVLCVSLSMSVAPTVKTFYEHRSGQQLGDSIPYIAWISMGMCEPSWAGLAQGWYNYGATLTTFENNDFDAEKTSKASIGQIKEHIRYFMENPQYARDFYYNKFVSQWNETTYQSVWNNTVRLQYRDKGKISAWVCDREKGRPAVERCMDIYTQFIFAAVFFGMFVCFKDKDMLKLIFPLIILGGLLYHLLSEAKSQYSIPYFILMTGFAAYGICTLHDFLKSKTADIKWLSWLIN